MSVAFLSGKAQGHVHYDIEPAIREIETGYLTAWYNIRELDGYRIQILSVSGTGSKVRAERVFRQFAEDFPDVPVYLVFSEPNFQILAGNFHSRLQAYKVLSAVQPVYPSAFIVKTGIEFRDN